MMLTGAKGDSSVFVMPLRPGSLNEPAAELRGGFSGVALGP